MRVVVCYGNTGCKTGKMLYESLRRKLGKRVKRVRGGRIIRRVSSVIRLGNAESLVTNVRPSIQINTPEAILNASSKLRMAQILSSTEGVSFPSWSPVQENLEGLKNSHGFFFVRPKHGKVRYDTQVTANDLYVTKPLFKKRREYRVHVLFGEVVGVYEKIPNNPDTRIFNSSSCKFSRVDFHNDNSRFSDEAIAMAIKATQAIGLDFAGLDMTYCKKDDGRVWYVLEVNSSFGLNTSNIDKYSTIIMNRIQDGAT